MHYLYKFEAMTTPCELHIYHESKKKADSVAKIVLEEAKRLEKKYNYYKEDSYLSLINQRKVFKLDQESKNLLQRASQYYKKTEKIFDITVATFKPLYSKNLSKDELQNQKEMLLPFVGCERFSIKRDKISFDNPYTMIDLGGFVKEYAVDRAVAIIKKHKIKSALVNFGGDIYAIGKKPNKEHFRVGIVDPEDRDKKRLFVDICDEALTTSASYERFYKIDGEIHSHIFSKDIMINSPKSVTVISPSCVQSGVYSTSLMVNPKLKTSLKTIIL